MMFCCRINVIIIRGITFWIVIRINEMFHSIPSITEIIQKWKGNIPSFINIDIIKSKYDIVFRFSKFMENLKRKILDEIPWIKKYNIVDFSLKIFLFIDIRGIKENRLISILIHIDKNELDEKQIKILLIKEIKKMFFWIKNKFFIS